MRSWVRRVDWAGAGEWAVLTVVLGIAALVSYTHLRDVWVASGSPWPYVGPLLVDGLFAAAWLRMRRRRRAGVPVGWLAWFALVLALLATLAGNLAAPWVHGRTDLLAYVVAAWPALAFALVWELVTGHGRGGVQRDAATTSNAEPPTLGDHDDTPTGVGSPTPGDEPPTPPTGLTLVADTDRELAELLAKGNGRRKVAEHLGISEHDARERIKAHRERVRA